MDVLIAVGRKASLQNEAIKFYQALTMSRAEHPETLSNCPFLDLENVCDIMVEAPDKLAVSLRYFLQGMSLVPPQPVKHTQPAWMSITPLRPRAFSLDEPKRPFTRRFSSFKWQHRPIYLSLYYFHTFIIRRFFIFLLSLS